MNLLKIIGIAFIELAKCIWFLPQTIGRVLGRKDLPPSAGADADADELERLDRIRNPSKYLDAVNAAPPDAT
jgi:hypothetical protein